MNRALTSAAVSLVLTLFLATPAMADWKYLVTSADDEFWYYLDTSQVTKTPEKTYIVWFKKVLNPNDFLTRTVIRGRENLRYQSRMEDSSTEPFKEHTHDLICWEIDLNRNRYKWVRVIAYDANNTQIPEGSYDGNDGWEYLAPDTLGSALMKGFKRHLRR